MRLWRAAAAAGFLAVLSGCAAHRPGPGSAEDPSLLSAATLEGFAGTWSVAVHDSAGNALPGHILSAASDATGWSQSFPERPGIPVRVLAARGDLVVFQAGPYESVLRPGVRVTAVYVTYFSGDRSHGQLVAWYEGGPTPIPVLRGSTEGLRSH